MKNVYVTVELRTVREAEHVDDLGDLAQEWGLFTASQEVFWVVAFDPMANLRSVVEIARGNQYEVTVDIAATLTAVLATGTNRFMVMHNHPSGRVTPTKRDLDLTKQLMVAGGICGMWLEDHIVIGPPDRWYSLRDHGKIVPAAKLLQLMAANGASGPVWTHREEDER